MHDFPAQGVGQARPYGIFELARNHGYVRVGDDHDTPRFAVESIVRWWREVGSTAYPRATRLLILADAGGSNDYRSRVWKYQLQGQLSDAFGLTVTVCHYPPGSSKWNPIEHRLFGFITMNWAGKPLRTFQTLVGFIGQTTTRAGLAVTGVLSFGHYPIGEGVSNAEWQTLNIVHHEVCPRWNYTIAPRTQSSTASSHEEAV